MGKTRAKLIAEYEQIHSARDFSSGSSYEVGFFKSIIRKYNPASVLDYGSGRSSLIDELSSAFPRIKGFRYDPAVPEYSVLPAESVDLVICVDVLEHIPEEDLHDVLSEIKKLAPVAVFIVSCRLAAQLLSDGSNAHCTVYPPRWWMCRLGVYYKKVAELLWNDNTACCLVGDNRKNMLSRFWNGRCKPKIKKVKNSLFHTDAIKKKIPGRAAIITSNICGRRQLDLAKFRRFLARNDIIVVNDPSEADSLFFWGCAFNASSEKESLDKLENLAASDKKIYVMEGLSVVATRALAERFSPGRLEVLPYMDIGQLNARFSKGVAYEHLNEENILFSNPESDCWSVQVAHGCNDNCAYCGDKKIVGDLRSKPLHDIKRECEAGVKEGFSRIHLLGDDVGAYGLDIGVTVIDLLRMVSSLSGVTSISIEELNIKYLIASEEEFREILQKKKIQFMVLAFQHSQDRILEKMKRGYTKKQIDSLLGALKDYDIDFSFHAIICFPGESDSEFERLLDFIVGRKMNSGTVFIFQPRWYISQELVDGAFPEHVVTSRIERAKNHFAANGYDVEAVFGYQQSFPYKLWIRKANPKQ